MNDLCYADQTNYRVIFLNMSMGNIHNSKALLEHHLEFQNPRFKVSPPGQSKLQTLKYSAFCVKPRAHAWSYWIIWDTQAKRCKRALCEAGC